MVVVWPFSNAGWLLNNTLSPFLPRRATGAVYETKGYPLEPGDEIIVEAGDGGGYGLPSELPRELLERDVRRGGYVSVEAAEREYGVRIEISSL
jgi:N-methylhydantoinase B/oxoprolinase/acetone carboxylase alpha subunit